MPTYVLTSSQLNNRILNSFSIPASGGPVIIVDADAQAFITAAAITDSTQQAAIDNLVIGLKADGLWTNMKVIYPFVGGTASSHKWNLKDPRDLDAAYRLTFSGGWTHNANGITGNGVNSYADMYIGSAFSIGVYSRVSTSGTFLAAGVITTDNECIPNNPYYLQFSGTGVTSGVYGTSSGSEPWTKFFSIVDENTGLPNQTNIYRNGLDIGNLIPANASWLKGNNNYLLGAQGFYIYDCDNNLTDYSISGYTNANLAFTYLSDFALNATQNANLNNRVVTFQTALSRNV